MRYIERKKENKREKIRFFVRLLCTDDYTMFSPLISAKTW